MLGPYLLTLLLLLPSCGLSWFYYKAQRERYSWAHTHFAGADFACTLTAPALARLTLLTFLATVCTFGLAKPWVDVMRARYMLDNLRVVGDMDLESIVQDARRAAAAGEGLTDFIEMGLLDVEVGF